MLLEVQNIGTTDPTKIIGVLQKFEKNCESKEFIVEVS